LNGILGAEIYYYIETTMKWKTKNKISEAEKDVLIFLGFLGAYVLIYYL